MAENKDMQIVLVPVDKVIPYWRNPRRNDKTVDALVNIVLPKHGFNVPIVLDKNYVVVKGHARLKAAKKLGMKTVPCVFTDASPEAIKADRIADNAIQEMSLWDMTRLEVEWKRVSRPEIERLFHSEDVKRMDVNFGALERTEYQSTGLDDDDCDDCGETGVRMPSQRDDYGQDCDAVKGGEEPREPGLEPSAVDFDPFEHLGKGSQGETSGNDSEPFQPQFQPRAEDAHPSVNPSIKKLLKTMCPYCGGTVYVKL